ncbi:MAG: hypothetical protein RL308_740 [Bacteroidota bacterium]|jgi:hypothetical protein
MNYSDRIFPTNKGLTTYLEELLAKNYQIPTFQRDVAWAAIRNDLNTYFLKGLNNNLTQFIQHSL